MNHVVIGKLQASTRGSFVTHKEGRTQIRSLCKTLGVSIGTFKSKVESRGSITASLADGSGYVTAARRPDAEVVLVKEVPAKSLDPEVLQQVEADGLRGDTKRKSDV